MSLLSGQQSPEREKKLVFLTARVHPGESPASFICQGKVLMSGQRLVSLIPSSASATCLCVVSAQCQQRMSRVPHPRVCTRLQSLHNHLHCICLLFFFMFPSTPLHIVIVYQSLLRGDCFFCVLFCLLWAGRSHKQAGFKAHSCCIYFPTPLSFFQNELPINPNSAFTLGALRHRHQFQRFNCSCSTIAPTMSWFALFFPWEKQSENMSFTQSIATVRWGGVCSDADADRRHPVSLGFFYPCHFYCWR